MTDQPEVRLDAATPSDEALLSNLLELYMHDLSAIFPNVELGADGRFGYRRLPLYWSEPEQRFAFIVRSGERIAGFVLAMRGSPASDDANVFHIAEFFVLRSFRRSGVGRRAAQLLWNRFPGAWLVRVSEGNLEALPFWTRTITEFGGGTATTFERPGSPHPWRVFSFTSAPPPQK
jgi:predicted acetyltransferase